MNKRKKRDLLAEEAHVAVVLVSPVFFTQMLIQGRTMPRTVCVQGLPKDAEFLYAFYDYQQNVIGLVYYHPDFYSVPDFQSRVRIPSITPIFQRYYEE